MRPWQIPSLALGLALSFPIRRDFDAAAVAAEVDAVLGSGAFTPQSGPYHDGGWTRLGLVSPSGDPARTYAREGEAKAKTPILKAMPTVERLLDSFGGPIRSATLSLMAPGGVVRWHTDARQSLDLAYVRLHVPVHTDPAAVTTIGHRTLHMAPGRVWYGDFTFPHRVVNGSAKPRLHIMFDVPSTPDLARDFPEAYLRQARRRGLARRVATRAFNLGQRVSAEGREARAARARRDAEAKASGGAAGG